MFAIGEVAKAFYYKELGDGNEGASGADDLVPVLIMEAVGGNHADGGGVVAHARYGVLSLYKRPVAHNVGPGNGMAGPAKEGLRLLPVEQGGQDKAGFPGVGDTPEKVDAARGEYIIN